jgi:hypothetical protein
MRTAFHSLLVLPLAVAAACAPRTELKAVHIESGASQGGPARKVLVAAFSGRPELRAKYEADMAARLGGTGVQIVQASKLFPPRPEPPTVDELRAAIAKEGIDGAVLARLAGTHTEERVVTTTTAYGPAFGPYGFYDYWGPAWMATYPTSYLEQEQVVTLETRFYRTAGSGKLVWTAMTDTFDPATAEEVIAGVNEKVVARLRSDGLVP